MLWINFHQSKYGIILAMCDEDLLDKVIIVNEKYSINMRDYKYFYKGIYVRNFEEINEHLIGKNIYSINAFGKNSVEFLMQKKIIDKKHVNYYGEKKDIPHAQVYYISSESQKDF